MSVRVIFSAVPDGATAARIARALVEERLCACVSQIPGAVSVYRWQGAVEESQEVILFAKTSDTATFRAVERLRELHPYDCPEVLVLDVTGGDADYLRWITESTGAPVEG